jgi:hypothetical protein
MFVTDRLFQLALLLPLVELAQTNFVSLPFWLAKLAKLFR